MNNRNQSEDFRYMNLATAAGAAAAAVCRSVGAMAQPSTRRQPAEATGAAGCEKGTARHTGAMSGDTAALPQNRAETCAAIARLPSYLTVRARGLYHHTKYAGRGWLAKRSCGVGGLD